MDHIFYKYAGRGMKYVEAFEVPHRYAIREICPRAGQSCVERWRIDLRALMLAYDLQPAAC